MRAEVERLRSRPGVEPLDDDHRRRAVQRAGATRCARRCPAACASARSTSSRAGRRASSSTRWRARAARTCRAASSSSSRATGSTSRCRVRGASRTSSRARGCSRSNCRTIEQMRLANALCRFVELADARLAEAGVRRSRCPGRPCLGRRTAVDELSQSWHKARALSLLPSRHEIAGATDGTADLRTRSRALREDRRGVPGDARRGVRPDRAPAPRARAPAHRSWSTARPVRATARHLLAAATIGSPPRSRPSSSSELR